MARAAVPQPDSPAYTPMSSCAPRVCFPRVEDKKLDYIKAADKVLKDIPHICEMDIGHTAPNMTLINGALADVKYKDGKGSISFKLK